MSSFSNDFHLLDFDQTDRLLERIAWTKGICPNGTLAAQNSFVLQQRPSITIHPEATLLPVTTELITEQDWDAQLVTSGVITHLNDDAMMNTLAHFFMLFHASSDKRCHTNTIHSIHLRKHASFKLDQISRPTQALQQRLDRLLSAEDTATQWQILMDIWQTFGFLWPRKIILGYRIERRQTYSFQHPVESINAFYSHLDILKEEMHSVLKDHQQYPYQLALFELDAFLKHSEIVARVDLDPMHTFLVPEKAQLIHDLIHRRFVQLTTYQPIKLYNLSTNSYLCWDPKRNHDTVIDDALDFLVRAVTATEPMSLNTQYLWRLTHTSITSQQPLSTQPSPISGSDRLFLYPACQSRLPNESREIDTHTMALSSRPYQSTTQQPSRDFSKLRGLCLVSHEHTEVDWALEYPDNSLKYMTEAQVNIKLNFHEHLRSRKPVVEGDLVQLQQIGLLTVFDPAHPKRSSKKNVLCVDEDLTKDRWTEKTLWKIELANQQDMQHHQATFYPWPPHSATKESNRKSPIQPGLNSEKAKYFEALIDDQNKSKLLLYRFAKKASLQPLAQLAKPSKPKQL